jgi:hypothetical protein
MQIIGTVLQQKGSNIRTMKKNGNNTRPQLGPRKSCSKPETLSKLRNGQMNINLELLKKAVKTAGN